MKRFILIPAMLVWLCATAQKGTKLPDFGKVDASELKMSGCSFEKNAAAMYLFNSCESYASFSGLTETVYHVRIKIFNKKGFESANIKIRYPSSTNDIAVKHLTAQTYNLDESGNVVVTKVDKSSIFDTKINKRYSEKTFAFPGIKEGSVIEYKYTLDGDYKDFWYFQKDIPVQLSRFVMDMPRELIVSSVPHVTMPMKRQDIKTSADNNATEYIMENIPGLPDEPYMSCREDYLERMETRFIAIEFIGQPRKNLMVTWPQLIRLLMEDEDFGTQLKKNIPRTSELDAMLTSVTDPFQKMSTIHKYVREHMEWNKYDNIWALDGVKSAWKDKKGTSGEINLILVNLLKDADLDAHAVLVSTRENGIVNTRVAEVSQFNKVMAYVTIGERGYVLDATEKETASNLIPFEVMASEGLVIEKPASFEWGWKVLWDDTHSFDKDVFVNATLDTKGMMKGGASVTSKDYARVQMAPLLKNGDSKMIEALKAGSEIKIDSFEVTGKDNINEPLKETFDFSTTTATSGDYHYFSANLFMGLEKNLFLADERKTDIFFGTNQHYSITAFFELPDGYQPDELPKNLKMIMPDTSIIFRRQASFSGNMLSIYMSLDFKSPMYTVDSYPEFNEFYKRLFELLNEKFVYRKK